MRNYKQLTQTERYQIYALRKANKNPTEISRVLGRHKSTIYRELKRNLGKRGYRAIQAHQFAVERHMSRDRRRISLEDWRLIESLIRRDWSPEQISLWLKKYKKIRVSKGLKQACDVDHTTVCSVTHSGQFDGCDDGSTRDCSQNGATNLEGDLISTAIFEATVY